MHYKLGNNEAKGAMQPQISKIFLIEHWACIHTKPSHRKLKMLLGAVGGGQAKLASCDVQLCTLVCVYCLNLPVMTVAQLA